MPSDPSLLAAIRQPVEIFPCDPAWPARFAAERDRLLRLFPAEFLAIEHFGSTAVPGLAAKPILDLLAAVSSLDAADALLPRLCQVGYDTSAEFNATLTDRRWLMRHAHGRRTHHLHLVVQNTPVWQQSLTFRNALRADPALAARYEAHKRDLATRHAADREAYTPPRGPLSDPSSTHDPLRQGPRTPFRVR